jgi:hypothetical protein
MRRVLRVPPAGIAAQMSGIAIVALLPLALWAGYSAWREAEAAPVRAAASLQARADGMAGAAGAAVAKVQQMIEVLSERPEVRGLDGAACQRLLQDLVRIDPLLANAGVADATGRPVCISMRGPGPVPVQVGDRRWFQQAHGQRGHGHRRTATQ